MKPSTAALRSLLASRQFWRADLYAFALVNAGGLYYCTGDRDILWDGETYSSRGPLVDRRQNRAKAHWINTLQVDTWIVDFAPKAGDLVNGVGFLSAVRQGVFDGAELTVSRAFMPSYGNLSAGVVTLFAGRVVEIDLGRNTATFQLNSHLELLNQNMPRNLYQPGCVNTLGDAACTVGLTAYTLGGTAAAGSTATVVLASGFAQASDYFDQGVMRFTSGANAGSQRTVKLHTEGSPASFALLSPFPSPPAPGDAFTVYPGCAKDFSPNGCPKFANLANFRATPFVPVPETAT
jgi:uncharacterized phage protein (TIGR02218 family)